MPCDILRLNQQALDLALMLKRMKCLAEVWITQIPDNPENFERQQTLLFEPDLESAGPTEPKLPTR